MPLENQLEVKSSKDVLYVLLKLFVFFNKKRACKLARDIKSSNVNYSTLELIRLCI